MSKLTLIGDPHAENKNLDKIAKLFDIIEELGNPALLLGDLFHTKEVIRGKTFNYVRDRLKNSKLNFIILVGNHDYFNLECQDHSLQILKDLPNVQVVDGLFKIGIGHYAMPYVHDLDKFRELVKSIPKDSTVFMHQGFSNFDYGTGSIAQGESELSDIAHLRSVISGHFHKYQNSKNLTYLGTPFSHSFGESNQDKYIGIYDTESRSLELFNSPFPKHLTIEVSATDRLEDWKLPRDYHLKFVVKGSSEELLRYNKAYLRGLSDIEVRILEKPSDEFLAGTTIDETADNSVQFQTWANDIKGLSPEIINLGLQILEAVNAK